MTRTRLLASLLLLSLGSGVAISAPLPATVEVGRPIVIGQSYKLPSRVLGDTRVVNVYLPEGYEGGSRSFPVLYLLDGGEHEDFFHIAALAQINAAYGQGQELIVVGVEGVDRRHDLTSPSAVSADQKLAPTSGGAAAYRQFLIEELKPWVASHYRTTDRSALIGESLAGLFVLETMLDQPNSFSDFISISPSLWWNDGDLVHSAAPRLRQIRFNGTRLWVGFETPAPPAQTAAKDRALQRQLENAFRTTRPAEPSWNFVRMNETHATIYHPAARSAFRALFGRSDR